jgi:flagellar hook-length control protein FliK
MPINAATLHKAAFFMYFDSELRLDFSQIKFLLDENFPAEAKTIESLKAHLEGAASLKNQALELLDALEKLPEAELKNVLEILKKFAPKAEARASRINLEGGQNKTGAQTAMPEASAKAGPEIVKSAAELARAEFLSERFGKALGKTGEAAKQAAAQAGQGPGAARSELRSILDSTFFVDVAKTGLKELGSFYKELDQTAARLMEYITSASSRSGEASEPLKEMLRPLAEMRGNLDFLNQVSDTKDFLQIPFSIGQDVNEAELHVFKNKRKKATPGVNTAFIALNYPHLGEVQVHITRTGDKVRLGFFAETGRALYMLAGETYKLSAAISAAGLSIAGFSFKKISDNPEIHYVPEHYADTTGGISKYSVDVRV